MIGVLALQGNYKQHAKILADLKHKPVFVRKPQELDELDALIIPGGESSSLLKLMSSLDFIASLKKFHLKKKPCLAPVQGLLY